MYYKLSNIAKHQSLEKAFGIPFEYPDIYEPKKMIDGLNEENLPIIAAESPGHISSAIWGILPEGYKDQWSTFQNLSNTLEMPINHAHNLARFGKPERPKRCVVLVTGFFGSLLHRGEIHPFLITAKSGEAFCIAGLYNTLADGFKTCTILLDQASEFLRQVHSIGCTMPLTVPKNSIGLWFDPTTNGAAMQEKLKQQRPIELKAHPIAKEFYKNNIIYDTFLDSVAYKNFYHTQ